MVEVGRRRLVTVAELVGAGGTLVWMEGGVDDKGGELEVEDNGVAEEDRSGCGEEVSRLVEGKTSRLAEVENSRLAEVDWVRLAEEVWARLLLVDSAKEEESTVMLGEGVLTVPLVGRSTSTSMMAVSLLDGA